MNDRRSFLQTGAAGILLLKPQTVFGYQANSALEIGIVGCGGRGNYVGDFFVEFTGARVVALADPVAEPLEAAKAKYKVGAPGAYGSVQGYRDLAASQLDAVLITSPPYFHPEQAAAAEAAGKHVYLAKPVAVDTAGCLSIESSAERAKGKRSFWVDFQSRARPVFQEAAERVHRGDIGVIPIGQMYYHTGYPKVNSGAGLDPARARMREWLGNKVLSGDIIVEQHIHAIDIGNWLLNGHPLKASGTYGRKVRTNGDCSDWFIVRYTYPDNIPMDHSSVQLTKGYNDICARVFGSKGTADTHYGGQVHITGENAWKGSEKDDTFRQGCIDNVKKFVESVRTGNFINNGATAVESTLTAVLGRTAAYRGTEVTWEQMLREKEKLDAKLAG